MSEATAKATRRTLRRAVGATAVSAITEQGDLLASHDQALAVHALQIRTLHDDDLTRVEQIERLSTLISAFQARLTLGQRLSWLLLGHL